MHYYHHDSRHRLSMHRTPPSQSCMLTVDGTLKAGIDTLPSGCIQVGIDDEQMDALIKIAS